MQIGTVTHKELLNNKPSFNTTAAKMTKNKKYGKV
jgi:hypothetical protein